MLKSKKPTRADGLLVKSFSYEGKRYYVYGRTEEELYQRKAERLVDLRSGRDKVENPTLDDYYEHFTEVRRTEVKPSTLWGQGKQFRALSSTELQKGVPFGSLRVKQITRRTIEDVRLKMLSNGLSAEYVNIIMQHLNHVLNSAVADDTIVKNPCRSLKQLKRSAPQVKDTIHRALTTEETKKFFDAAEARGSFYLNHFRVMIMTGLRVGELAALTPENIDMKSGFIHVHKTIQRTEEGGYAISDTAKTPSGVRDVPLTDEIVRLIREQRATNVSAFELAQVRGLIFVSSTGEMLREYTINREIARICKTAEIEPFTCHAFRNTFATRFIEQRPQDYKILSDIMGHKDISITLNLYAHVMSENKVKAMHDISIL